jgi:3-oxoacyl-[acyl-carrier-protein] synthase-3
MTKINAAITGIHAYVPNYVLSNEELEKMVDTNDEWIMTRTGIRERRILKGEDQGTSIMGIEAVKGLMEKTNTNPEDVGFAYLFHSNTRYAISCHCHVISDGAGIKNAFSFV